MLWENNFKWFICTRRSVGTRFRCFFLVHSTKRYQCLWFASISFDGTQLWQTIRPVILLRLTGRLSHRVLLLTMPLFMHDLSVGRTNYTVAVISWHIYLELMLCDGQLSFCAINYIHSPITSLVSRTITICNRPTPWSTKFSSSDDKRSSTALITIRWPTERQRSMSKYLCPVHVDKCGKKSRKFSKSWQSEQMLVLLVVMVLLQKNCYCKNVRSLVKYSRFRGYRKITQQIGEEKRHARAHTHTLYTQQHFGRAERFLKLFSERMIAKTSSTLCVCLYLPSMFEWLLLIRCVCSWMAIETAAAEKIVSYRGNINVYHTAHTHCAAGTE